MMYRRGTVLFYETNNNRMYHHSPSSMPVESEIIMLVINVAWRGIFPCLLRTGEWDYKVESNNAFLLQMWASLCKVVQSDANI